MAYSPLHIHALARAAHVDRSASGVARPANSAGHTTAGPLRAQPGTAGTGGTGGSAFEARLEALLQDPLMADANRNLAEQLLGEGGGANGGGLFGDGPADDAGNERGPFESTLLGSMNAVNLQALALLEDQLSRANTAMPRPAAGRNALALGGSPLAFGGSPLASVRSPLNRTPLATEAMARGISSMPGNPSVAMALQGLPVDLGGTMLAALENDPDALEALGAAAGPGNPGQAARAAGIHALRRAEQDARAARLEQASLATQAGPGEPDAPDETPLSAAATLAALVAPDSAAAATRPDMARSMARSLAAYARAAAAAPAPTLAPTPAPTPDTDAARASASRNAAAPDPNAPPATAARHARHRPHPGVTGVLAAHFESGRHGLAAIGYDPRGGTSYGKYQISSRRGSMKDFLAFLDDRAPDLARRLRRTGPTDTGGRTGAMPMEWRRIAAEQPSRFMDLQDEFIHRANYRPALQDILEETNINIGNGAPALREVLWSTAVQHGSKGAADIFVNATHLAGVEHAEDPASVKKLIEAVYDERKGRFFGSSRSIQSAVSRRLDRERDYALALLADNGDPSI
ncbi:MAG: hypothetical protein H0S85_12160 [Desulfovibrionaceae bacterium]|jgi:hypothetical protein|nr:hypothetical protein [Desulfovibrionaceae bacterium]